MQSAGFGGGSISFVELLLKQIGADSELHTISDSQLSKLAGKDQRTIRRWRAQFKRESTVAAVSLLKIEEGDFKTLELKYELTKYQFPVQFLNTLEQAVCHFLALDPKHSDRHRLATSTAKQFAVDLPQQVLIKSRKTRQTRRIGGTRSKIRRAVKLLEAAVKSERFVADFQNDALGIKAEFEKIRALGRLFR